MYTTPFGFTPSVTRSAIACIQTQGCKFLCVTSKTRGSTDAVLEPVERLLNALTPKPPLSLAALPFACRSSSTTRSSPCCSNAAKRLGCAFGGSHKPRARRRFLARCAERGSAVALGVACSCFFAVVSRGSTTRCSSARTSRLYCDPTPLAHGNTPARATHNARAPRTRV